jgi:hypothetical protein
VSKRLKVTVAALVTLAAVNAGTNVLQRLTGGTPGGPRSSSYATGGDGLAAYLSLLVDDGHQVRRVHAYPAGAGLDRSDTAFVLDAQFVAPRDAQALRLFVAAGGRLVVGGAEPAGWLRELVSPAPVWSSTAPSGSQVLAPVPELAGIGGVVGDGSGSWRSTGAALAAFGGTSGSLLAVAAAGKGRVLFLADASPLQNRLLASADNARFAEALAGAPDRPVVFFESYHGYGPTTGVGRIPRRWLVLLAGLGLAALTLMVARGRRLGPPEAETRELPPPRRVYVLSLAGVLARTRKPAEALEPVRTEARARIAKRAGLPPDAAAESVAAAARRLGLPEAEIDAMLGVGANDPVLGAGRALAHAGRSETRETPR